MNLSKFGSKFTNKSGILQLMDDLGNALAGGNMLMLGGGNPAHIPEVEDVWRSAMQNVLDTNGDFEKMIGNYTTPQGDPTYLQSLAKLFKNEYGWNITEKNIAIMPGSQTAFFFLFNLIAGDMPDGTKKKILLPLVPEYIGYADQGITEDLFAAVKPTIEYIDIHTFKYKIDFSKISPLLSGEKNNEPSPLRRGQGEVQYSSIAAICVSRPTNPTGNVVTDEEINKLHTLAKEHNIPLIIDNAYGAPFPNILFTDITPVWDEDIIYSLSLSKLGLPSTRTSIVIAKEEIISHLSSINAIVSLAPGRLGEYLTKTLIDSGELLKVSRDHIKPYYQKKSEAAIAYFHSQMDTNIPYYLHKSEGALFLWLWCKDLPITSKELYAKLKERGVLVVPGEYFFPGLQEDWQHQKECLRITYSQAEETVTKGLSIIAEEIKKLY